MSRYLSQICGCIKSECWLTNSSRSKNFIGNNDVIKLSIDLKIFSDFYQSLCKTIKYDTSSFTFIYSLKAVSINSLCHINKDPIDSDLWTILSSRIKHSTYYSSFMKLQQLRLHSALKTWINRFAIKIWSLSSKVIKKHVKGFFNSQAKNVKTLPQMEFH